MINNNIYIYILGIEKSINNTIIQYSLSIFNNTIVIHHSTTH